MDANSGFDLDSDREYIRLCPIGTGTEMDVSLVQSHITGELFARREASFLSETHEEEDGQLHTTDECSPNGMRLVSQAPYEIIIALSLQHISGIATLCNWTTKITHLSEVQGQPVSSPGRDHKLYALEVSHWHLYNLGDLRRVIDNPVSLPEYWIARLLTSMIDTLMQMHQSGVAHMDTHSKNWLLEYDAEDTNIVLTDFGNARRLQDCLPGHFYTWCADDYGNLFEIISLLLRIDAEDLYDEDMTFADCLKNNAGASAESCSESFLALIRGFRMYICDHALGVSDHETFFAGVKQVRDGFQKHAQTLSFRPWPISLLKLPTEHRTGFADKENALNEQLPVL